MRSLYESILSKSGVGIEESIWRWIVKNVRRITVYKGKSVEYDRDFIIKNPGWDTDSLEDIRNELFLKVFELGKTVKLSRVYGLIVFDLSEHPETPKFKFEPYYKDQVTITFPALCDSSQFSIKDTFGPNVRNVDYHTSLNFVSDIHIYKKTLDGLKGESLKFIGGSNSGKEEVMGLNELAGEWEKVIFNDVTIPLNAKPSKDIKINEFVQGIKLIFTNMDWLPLSCKQYQHRSHSRPVDFTKIDKHFDPKERILHLSDGRKIPVNPS